MLVVPNCTLVRSDGGGITNVFCICMYLFFFFFFFFFLSYQKAVIIAFGRFSVGDDIMFRVHPLLLLEPLVGDR